MVKYPPTTRHTLERCTPENMRTELEKNYLEVYESNYFHCLHMDENLELRNIKE